MSDRVNFDYLEQNFSKLPDVRSVLEVGSRNVNHGNSREFIRNKGLEYLGVDREPGPDVDKVVDILDTPERIRSQLGEECFDLVICMNVLEHVYEPIKALDNMRRLVKKNGYILVVTPLVWDLHAHPFDYYRLNPDFFKRYMQDRQMTVVEGTFLLSERDTRRFYTDTTVLPMLIPEWMRQGVLKFLTKGFCKIFARTWYESWSHIYLNLIMQKN